MRSHSSLLLKLLNAIINIRYTFLYLIEFFFRSHLHDDFHSEGEGM